MHDLMIKFQSSKLFPKLWLKTYVSK